MRAALGVISILIVLAVVGLLARKQLAVAPAVSIHQQNPALVDQSAALPPTSPVRSQQIQQQIKQSVEAGMQPRAMPDDEK